MRYRHLHEIAAYIWLIGFFFFLGIINYFGFIDWAGSWWYWPVGVFSILLIVSLYERHEFKKFVLGVLKNRSGKISIEQLSNAIKSSESDLRKAILDLIAEGKINGYIELSTGELILQNTD
ncbi:MAG: PCI domain-containing protein [Candidatus Odinarchaeia archaeon]